MPGVGGNERSFRESLPEPTGLRCIDGDGIRAVVSDWYDGRGGRAFCAEGERLLALCWSDVDDIAGTVLDG